MQQYASRQTKQSTGLTLRKINNQESWTESKTSECVSIAALTKHWFTTYKTDTRTEKCSIYLHTGSYRAADSRRTGQWTAKCVGIIGSHPEKLESTKTSMPQLQLTTYSSHTDYRLFVQLRLSSHLRLPLSVNSHRQWLIILKPTILQLCSALEIF